MDEEIQNQFIELGVLDFLYWWEKGDLKYFNRLGRHRFEGEKAEGVDSEFALGFLKAYGLESAFRVLSGGEAGFLKNTVSDRVRDAINAVLSGGGSDDPEHAIEEFKDRLVIPNTRPRRQLSAATKLMFFLRPDLRLMIFDSQAAEALKAFAKQRGLKSKWSTEPGGYTPYLHAGLTFVSEVPEAIAGNLDGLVSAAKLPEESSPLYKDFLVRRAVDKVLFWQGKILSAKPLPADRAAVEKQIEEAKNKIISRASKDSAARERPPALC